MVRRVCIVSGAGRGIGRAVALRLAAEGFDVALLARTQSELLEVAALCPGAMALPTDVSQSAGVDLAVKAVVQRFGRIDALVHCAGVAPMQSLAGMSDALWRQVIDTNLSAAFYLCRAVWPTFERQRAGVVVNVSSEASRDPFDGFAAYAAAKAGLNLFGLSAAREGRKIGVRVHTVAPGAVETGMFRQILSPEQFPPEKTLSPDEVAKVIVDCVNGDLAATSGEVLYLHKT